MHCGGVDSASDGSWQDWSKSDMEQVKATKPNFGESFVCTFATILFVSLSHPDIQVGASVVQEQCEAEGDMSLQQRVLMGAGTALEGSSELVEDEIAAGM